MIVPVIRYFASSDAPDPASFVPADPARFSIELDMMIGPSGDQGEEQFTIRIATPAWLEERFEGEGLVSGEHTLIVFHFDWGRIDAYLRKRVAGCSGMDWAQVAGRISRFAYWEFADYEE